MSNVNQAVLDWVGTGAFMVALTLTLYCAQWVAREAVVVGGRPDLPRHISQLSWAGVAFLTVSIACAVVAVMS